MKFIDTHGNQAEIVFEPLAFGAPLAVWVFAFQKGQLVLGRSREGGLQWIVGTLGAGESAESAARRASLELVAARVMDLTAIGQFRGVRPDGGPRRSTIYSALAARLDPLPVDSLMREVVLVAPDDLTILRDGGGFMQDPSFSIVMTHLVAKGLVPT